MVIMTELDTPWDYVILSLQLIVTVLLLALTTYASVVVDTLRSITSRDTLMTSCMTFSFLIWMWSAFVSNQHLSLLLPLNSWSCVVWDFWLQYALGLNLAFTLTIIKLNWYRLMQERKKDLELRRQTGMLALWCSLPTVLVCAGVDYNGGTHLDLQSESCRADAGWKYALISCLLLNYVAVLALIVRGLCYQYITQAHKELLYGAAAASVSLLVILSLNVSRQLGHVYGRVLTAFCINVTCVSLFYGLIGLPLYYSLQRTNEYELAHQIKDTEIKNSAQIERLVDLLPYPIGYDHYLTWVSCIYTTHNSEGRRLLPLERSQLGNLILPDHIVSQQLMLEHFRELVQLSPKEDPQLFLFQPHTLIQLLKRLELMLGGARAPDSFWKKNIEDTFIRRGAKHHVPLPHRLQQELLHTPTDDVETYKQLLLCTRLWLLDKLEQLTWQQYRQDESSGLPSWIKTIQSPSVQQYLLSSDYCVYEGGDDDDQDLDP